MTASHRERFRFSQGYVAPLNGGEAARTYACTLLAAGELLGHGLTLDGAVVRDAVSCFSGAAAFVDHAAWGDTRRLDRLLGVFHGVHYNDETQSIDGVLELWDTPASTWAARIIDQVIAAQGRGQPAADIGLSADCWITVSERPDARGRSAISQVLSVESVDMVFRPASDGARFRQILAAAGSLPPRGAGPDEPAFHARLVDDRSEEDLHMLSTDHLSNDRPTANELNDDVQRTLQEVRQLMIDAKLSVSHLPQPMLDPIRRRALAGSDIETEIADARRTLVALSEGQVIQGFGRPIDAGGGVISGMTDPLDIARNAVRWLFGVKSAALPPVELRTPLALYHALTGDHEWRGHFSAERVRFARASASTLADLATDAMNVIIAEQWQALEPYRWFEPLVTVAPHDGSLNAMNWVSFGGIANLPTVAEGQTYSELNVADGKENDPFVKYGGYVGITEEMFRKNQMLKIQAIPRALAAAAVRTRSYYISYIFSQNSGVGPTLDDDSTALFHSNHSNHATTALSMAAWAAARTAMFEQTQLGSSKPLGIFPKFLLVPIELYDTALVMFGYGAGSGGYPGTADNDVNPYAVSRPGDPRPVVVAVPEWSDANNWYFLADPNIQPVIFMSYAQAPGGGQHPLPELFTVNDPTCGLIFTNDVLPIKVRDWFAYGVATYRGIGARVVA